MSSFEGLYTFADVASMYKMDQSTFRQNVGKRFIDSVDVKKFGKTWLIREEALVREFGFIPLTDNKESQDIKRKLGRKSTFDKYREAYENGKYETTTL
jgi:hypothetical protein